MNPILAGLELTLQDSGRHSHATRSAVFFVLVAFLVAFVFIRISTRLMRSDRVPWWPGSIVSEGGLHIHHLVFGIVLMLMGGTLGFALTDESPWVQLSAVAFGVGAGLTFDEFALWVHLEDVYWAEEGRQSVDAAVIAIVFIGMVLVGAAPVGVNTGSAALIVASIVLSLIAIGTAVVAFAKGRFMHGYVGLLFWPLSAWGALHLAKPHSAWARHLYGERRPEKQAAAEERYRDRRVDRFKERFRDIVGGRPSVTPTDSSTGLDESQE
jgi:hypothetical protein